MPRLLFGQTQVELEIIVQSASLVRIETELAAIATLIARGMIVPVGKRDFKNFKKILREAVDECFSEKSSDIYSNNSNDLADRIVGESYQRFDAMAVFYPTLIVKFKSESTGIKIYSQIKTRDLIKGKDIKKADIALLKKQASGLEGLCYTYGNIRCNFVAPDRAFKTTIYTEAKERCIKVFENLVPLTKPKFKEMQLSYTEKSNRIPYTRRTQSLVNIKVNPPDFKPETKFYLFGVFLQINGLEKQIRIF